ncbi:S9 family peptidase [Pedobacter sp. SYSU D00535]|uniref:alpha/beta hydrolase family protein n=1 Tax=Pedobacter sp. SYSU D00535 TaxID=2810308 RepID=UPI001A973307|nr:prolyl oligopeptidase family serine peptidase [Pedobacter sp. SYSU D00535]
MVVNELPINGSIGFEPEDKPGIFKKSMKTYIKLLILPLAGCLFQPSSSSAQKEKLSRVVAGHRVNYEEDSVGTYILPEVLRLQNGKKVKSVKAWNEQRRPELIRLFEDHQFGKMPAAPQSLQYKIFDPGTTALGGNALRKQVRVYLHRDTSSHKMDLLMYLPANTQKPSPLLLMINFVPNSTMVNDPGIRLGTMWDRQGKQVAAPAPRAQGGVDIEQFLREGIGVAMVYYGDIEPDFKGGLPYGIRSKYLRAGATSVGDDEWGTISAWAWGLSRAMDYFEQDQQVDPKRIALQGTSRLGKTVLWAGARDERFKAVIASCSGEGGAALSRRNYGESIIHMTDTSRYYYQFAPKRHSYGKDPNLSPVDAHMLVALMAPRALLLQTGDTDYWSDPKGEFFAALAAEPVYRLFRKQGPGRSEMPVAGEKTLLLNTLGYFMHEGGHGPIPSDWPLYLEYLKRHL